MASLTDHYDERARDVSDEVLSNEVRRLLLSGAALAPAGANVIMQMSWLSIGRAVAESQVESGSLYRHPIKRTRTTLAFIVIALFGTEEERQRMRAEVNRQHRSVHSSGDVAYDAFDPDLQRWVAACMYRGAEDSVTFLYGRPSDEVLDILYRRSASLATTLQVPATMWPKDRAAFEVYWSDALGNVAMDNVTREYLLGVASLRFLPRPLSYVLGPAHRFITTGFLPTPFREELGLSWSPGRQRLFVATLSTVAGVNRHLPRSIREVPWNLVLWDTRRRLARGVPVL